MAAITQNIEALTQEAINAAITLDWQKAIDLNRKILSSTKDNVEALNRLARAQSCCGLKADAQKTYKKALDIDPFNIIAAKNLDKISKSDGLQNAKISTYSNNQGNFNLTSLFLFEPGKTKLANLINLAPPSILASLNCGDQVQIKPKSHSVTITGIDDTYLGALPDDLAHRLIAFITGGNIYDAYIKSATTKLLTIFIREISRSNKFASQPSFQYKHSSSDEAEVAFF